MATKKTKNEKSSASQGAISTTASHDLFAVFIGDVAQNPDKIARDESSGKGLRLYEEMERKDGHMAAVLQTRKLSLSGKGWTVNPASDSPEHIKHAEFVEQVFLSMDFDCAVLSQLDALMKGFAVSEELYEQSEGQVWIKRFAHRKPWRFVFDKDGQLRMLTENEIMSGEEVPQDKFWVWSFDARYGNRYGNGLGQKLYWPYLFKKNNMKWWGIFNEKFGSPTAVGKYPPGTKKDKQAELLRAIDSIQQETGLTIPDDMAIELIEATRRGSFETYRGFLEWLDDMESKIVLGQTLTTQQGIKGARALGEVHERVARNVLKADADSLAQSLNNGPVRRLVDFNFSVTDNKYPRLRFITDNEKNLKDLSERDLNISRSGWKPTQEYIEETYGIKVEDAPTSGKHGSGGQFAEADVDRRDTPGFVVERLLDEANMDPMFNEVRKLIRAVEVDGGTLETLRDKLIDTYTEMDEASLGNLIQKALSVAHLAGMLDSKNGN